MVNNMVLLYTLHQKYARRLILGDDKEESPINMSLTEGHKGRPPSRGALSESGLKVSMQQAALYRPTARPRV